MKLKLQKNLWLFFLFIPECCRFKDIYCYLDDPKEEFLIMKAAFDNVPFINFSKILSS